MALLSIWHPLSFWGNVNIWLNLHYNCVNCRSEQVSNIPRPSVLSIWIKWPQNDHKIQGSMSTKKAGMKEIRIWRMGWKHLEKYNARTRNSLVVLYLATNNWDQKLGNSKRQDLNHIKCLTKSISVKAVSVRLIVTLYHRLHSLVLMFHHFHDDKTICLLRCCVHTDLLWLWKQAAQICIEDISKVFSQGAFFPQKIWHPAEVYIMRSQMPKVESRIFSNPIATVGQSPSICAIFPAGKACHDLHPKGLFHLGQFRDMGT